MHSRRVFISYNIFPFILKRDISFHIKLSTKTNVLFPLHIQKVLHKWSSPQKHIGLKISILEICNMLLNAYRNYLFNKEQMQLAAWSTKQTLECGTQFTGVWGPFLSYKTKCRNSRCNSQQHKPRYYAFRCSKSHRCLSHSRLRCRKPRDLI